ncbi:ABC transporter permease [Sphingobacterium sp. HJSM2_6]|uniref:ABC transporter permease n=1 Tax=Sphingobacterium sp. HJSM2_6 TaxID=3366264 RepID=UPI003BE6792D
MILKTALRKIKNNKLMTFINVLSLGIGISATLVIFLLVAYDYSFDKHVKDRDRVFRVVTNGEFKLAGTLTPLMRAMDEELSMVDLVVPILMPNNNSLKVPVKGDEGFNLFTKNRGLIFTNSQYFAIYPHTWIAGDAKILDKPNIIVLTDKDQKRFFPNKTMAEVLGETVVFADSINLTVGAVVAEMQENSEFKYSSFISTATIPNYPKLIEAFSWEVWNNYSDSNQSLIKIAQDAEVSAVEKAIMQLLGKYKKADDGFKDKFELQPITDVHFNPEYNYNATKPETLRNLIVLAIFLLCLGLVNFINLSTAQSIARAKEVGIRKTLGSSKWKLTSQFLLETFLITLTAAVLSLLLTPIFLKAFDGFIPKELSLGKVYYGWILLFVLLQVVLVSLLAGFYPAWIMTGYAPVLALKNQLSKNSNLSRSSWVRKALTIFQFLLAQVFLICVFIVVKQIDYVSQKDMGFNKEAVVNFFVPGAYQNGEKAKLLEHKLASIPEIEKLSLGNQSPAFLGQMTTSISVDHREDLEKLNLDARNGDEHFIEVYHIPLVAGRNIRMIDSKSEVLINEKALGLLNLKKPDDALGLSFNNGEMLVVGVMKDFDISSAKNPIRPLVYYGTNRGYVFHVKLDVNRPETWKSALGKMEKEFKAIFPNDEFDFKFLDENLAQFYTKEKQLSKLLTWAVCLSVLIAGLGLFGLAIFTANQRTKEIGIRKVLGASVKEIIFLLLRNQLVLVGIACVIAFPIAWYLGNNWLNDFTYKTEISWWMFPLSMLLLMLIASLVLLSKSYFAAKSNPVDSIRNE